jgi:gamma-glutamyltranspeptidase / glutathione hydrolase
VPAQVLDPSDPEDLREIRGSFGPGAAGPYQGRNGMVSTASHHATMAGLETLRAGGNAFDAAAVVQFALTVTEPYASGIGGGLLMVLFDAESGEVTTVDGREEAPRAFHPDAFRDQDGKLIPYSQRTTGGNAVGVPGTLAATAYLLEHYGTLTLAEALQPAIRLAREGFILPEPFARSLQTHWRRLSNYPESVALFSREDGRPLQEGDLFRNPILAETFELIARHGLAVFYEGEIAEEIVRTVQNDPLRPGVLELADMANYRPVQREPVSVTYRGYEVYGMNMPSSGGPTLGLILNMLEETGFADAPHGSPDSIHLLADAQNLAFADRNRYMGDADFVEVPVEGLLDKDYARERRGLLNTERALPTPVEAGEPQGAPQIQAGRINAQEGISTTHFSIVDRHRNVATVTSTIEQHFGSGLVVRGFLLNNELTDFDAEAYDADGNLMPNAPEGGWQPRRTALGEAAESVGGKRPRSSMTPTLVLENGEPRLSLGSPGGSRIIGITLNVLLNVLDHKMDVQTAINFPRAIARNGALELEAPFYRNRALHDELRRRGFELVNAQAVGAVQAIQIDAEGWLHGAADPRREGLAVGY